MANPATALERQAMNKAIAEVRRQHNAALVKANGIAASQVIPNLFLANTGINLAELKKLTPLIDTWAGNYFVWALNGKRSDGTDYSAARFLEYGKDTLASAIEQHGKEAFSSSAFGLAIETGKQSVATVVKAVDTAVKAVEKTVESVNPLNWPIQYKLLAGLVVGGVLVALVAPQVSAVATVVRALKGTK